MMKTRRNGDAIGLMCDGANCNAVYADVFQDRVLLYSFHYGRTHSTPIHADLFREISLLACEGRSGTVECVCGKSTCAAVETDRVMLESQHRVETATGKARESHRNIWGLQEIEQIGMWLGLIGSTMPAEFDVAEVKQAS